MTENQDANPTASDTTRSTLTHAKARRRLVVVAVLILLSAAIYFGPRTKSAYDASRAAAFASKRYEEGMHALKNKNYDEAKKLFSEALGAGDARGNFGIACMLYQREPNITLYPEGPASLRKDLAIQQLEYAASHRVYAAQAALIRFYWTESPFADIYQTTPRRGKLRASILSLLEAAKDGSLDALDDSALPKRQSGDKIERDPKAYVMRMLEEGPCAPSLSYERSADLIYAVLSDPAPAPQQQN